MEQPPPPGKDRAFGKVVEAAEEAVTNGGPLPPEVLGALLEDPIHVSRGKFGQAVYERVELQWESLEPVSMQVLDDSDVVAAHEVTQSFVRRLSFGRHRCYRVHRFLLPALDSWPALVGSSIRREQASVPGDYVHVSNVGGFHSVRDLFTSDRHPGADALMKCIAGCLRRVAVVDAALVEAAGETPPPSPRSSEDSGICDIPDGWVNVSRRGALNHLHHHADAALATVFYAQVPGEGGSLLLRLTPGQGQGLAEPDEERHVPQMWAAADAEVPSGLERSGVVRYIEVVPAERTLLVFPGFVSHSVAPHFSRHPRVSIASNWDWP